MSLPLRDLAKAITAKHNGSTIDETKNDVAIGIAKEFLGKSCPTFLASKRGKDTDRLVKIGRALMDLVEHTENLEEGLQLMVEECMYLARDDIKVPRVRYGKTELQIPIVTLGAMRFQQRWGDAIKNMDQVTPECQKNLVGILRHAILDLGMIHIETARGYGCSELQLGAALKELFDSGDVKREDLIIQTKVNAFSSSKLFRETLEKSFELLQLDYVDIFSFHGLNLDRQYTWLFEGTPTGGEKLYDIIQEYVKAGKIRHVGLSTHGIPRIIKRFIESDKFECANVHYHYFGSYTASGDGVVGNLEIVRLMKERDMGVFIISPYDKGGRLYAPSRKLRSLTLPEMEPMAFGSTWLWNHGEKDAPIHTIVCGAARPSDLDQPAVAAFRFGTEAKEMKTKLATVTKRLEQAKIDALGQEWVDTCYQGLPNYDMTDAGIQFTNMVWLYNVIQAYGMRGFALDRFSTFEGNSRAEDNSLATKLEKMEKIGIMKWGYMPGFAVEGSKDYSAFLSNVPEANARRVSEAIDFVYKWCHKITDEKENSERENSVPVEWKTGYDMRPWTAFPEQ
eukprot:CAMPEP_0118706374 /NCGR_PEP_ID=MMETSP0800-20121206/20518_1 /TAXON_ID=210618 ORGANISM="Striatella unipunctata, Strain CCMP2910" /NCGR_SAMPLE_ID=MMETSP0800 /ASSEMBLY_ACC=CAM_ASM_000638 /LENGTH=564 /DNA_ID=CAMNT_0006608893 /DNA_START=34 /DNA_END=1728 /DNA_ORIENTATION=-